MSLFTQITDRANHHNQTNYKALDSIKKHLEYGWNYCGNQEEYGDITSGEIPLCFIEHWCNFTDFEADGIKRNKRNIY